MLVQGVLNALYVYCILVVRLSCMLQGHHVLICMACTAMGVPAGEQQQLVSTGHALFVCGCQVLGMRLIRKAHLAPGHHECAYMSYKPSERDSTWIELLLADPAKVSSSSTHSLTQSLIWVTNQSSKTAVGSSGHVLCLIRLRQSQESLKSSPDGLQHSTC